MQSNHLFPDTLSWIPYHHARVRSLNDAPVNEAGDYILVWMQSAHRFAYHHGLEYAVAWANELQKPVVVYESMHCDDPWACDRFHALELDFMEEHLTYATSHKKAKQGAWHYWPHLEEQAGTAEKGFETLAEHAAIIITDDFPVGPTRDRNAKWSKQVTAPYVLVDANGLIPLGQTTKDPYSAYIFRKIVQKSFHDAMEVIPSEDPLAALHIPGSDVQSAIPVSLASIAPHGGEIFAKRESWMAGLPIRHDVAPVETRGSREAALQRMHGFMQFDLLEYDDKRNHPDEHKTSRLSPWLHYGVLSAHEVVEAALAKMPSGWSMDELTYVGGKSEGFFNGDPNIESFLNEVVTWREVGYHYCHHRPDYADYESLPNWAMTTIDEHHSDARPQLYTFEQLESGQTHDTVWNAAQIQLRQEGMIHNYLRMLWGKKVIEWAPDMETALTWLIELNNQWAIDGRNPNSYSGIFWCFGRFDRAWQEREIFGKLRYMSSDNTRKKVRMDRYLMEYAS
ncbi:MAG: hypothetical protein RI519_05000 [Balneolaceae bacterium]|nr:hypothetical protein [Balneolaceae bacterium]